MDTVEDSAPAAVRAGLPAWYWVVAVLALLWAIGGCYSYLEHAGMSAAEVAALPPEQRDLMNALPTWLTAVFAIAVWSGLGGAVALLLRKAWAYHLYLVSLVAVVVQFGWMFLATDVLATMGMSSVWFPLFIFVAALFLVWFSGMARRRGWIG